MRGNKQALPDVSMIPDADQLDDDSGAMFFSLIAPIPNGALDEPSEQPPPCEAAVIGVPRLIEKWYTDTLARSPPHREAHDDWAYRAHEMLSKTPIEELMKTDVGACLRAVARYFEEEEEEEGEAR